MDRHALTEAAAEYRYHHERMTELAADVETLADSAADVARALLAIAHELGEGRTLEDAARLLTDVLGAPWSPEGLARALTDALGLEGRREAMADLLEAHRIVAERAESAR